LGSFEFISQLKLNASKIPDLRHTRLDKKLSSVASPIIETTKVLFDANHKMFDF